MTSPCPDSAPRGLRCPGHGFDYSLYRRAAKATTLRAFANWVLAGHVEQQHVLLLGRHRRRAEAATTQILAGHQAGRSSALPVRCAGQGGPVAFKLAPLLPEGQLASRILRGRVELIDHIFRSRDLLQSVTAFATVAAGPLPSITAHAETSRCPTTPWWSPTWSCPDRSRDACPRAAAGSPAG